jgi:L-alanine-DL-glutamate epimerase-like enolase superfamily enzyme
MAEQASSRQLAAEPQRSAQAGARIERVSARAISLPTEEQPESDGTLSWNETTMVLVECTAAGLTGIGYSYVHASAAALVRSVLADCVRGLDPMAVGEAHMRMQRAIRNQGREGLVAAAISAVDVALWDLKARLLSLPLATLLGAVRDEVPAYGSGGFTSSGPEQLQRELKGYVQAGLRRAKIKVGREPAHDPARVRVARDALGQDVQLMVDANGAYTRKQALALAEEFAEAGVVWFEEPVSSDDLEGLRLMRDRGPVGMAIAAGEYGYVSNYFERMLRAEAVDILQADATRCGGVTGFLRVNALCDANNQPLSSHCAPTLHAHLGAAASRLVHLEYFKDHVRMEGLLFEGGPALVGGCLRFDPTRPGLGIALRQDQLARYQVQ